MTTLEDVGGPVGAAAPRRRKVRVHTESFWRRNGFRLTVLCPVLISLGVFVYGFIAYSVRVSLSNWQGLRRDLTVRQPAGKTYSDLLQTPRFQADLRNIFVFTALFLALAILTGLVLALLVHHALAAQPALRSIFLFPYALSFIVTGVVWRWIFTPSAGANLILGALGVDAKPKWITDPTVAGDVSSALDKVIPGGDFIQIELGIPLALIPVVVAASWQLAGFAMANFLAAMAALPPELKEAATLDGAGTRTYYWHIVLPLLRPVMIVLAVLLGHVSLKSFDLVYAMVGQGPGFATDVPGIFVFDTTFRALRYNTGAAASVVMLVLVCAVIAPYLFRSTIRGKK